MENRTPFAKDRINDNVVHGIKEAVNPEHVGSKAAAHYQLTLGSGETVVIRMRLTDSDFKKKTRLAPSTKHSHSGSVRPMSFTQR